MSSGEHLPWTHDGDPYLRPDLAHAALLIIDTQIDFIEGGATPIAGTAAAVPRMATVLKAFRSAGLPIVHVIRLYEGEDIDLLRRLSIENGLQVVRPGTEGSQIAVAVRPPGGAELDAKKLLAGDTQALGDNEFVIWKPRWSGFYRTSLDALLRDRGVTTVVLLGCNYPNCPRATIFDASERDYRVLIISDAISGIDERHLLEAEGIGALNATSDDVVAVLKSTFATLK